MEKAKKILKKPLLIASICVIVVLVIGLIIMATIPYAEATYKYRWSKYIEIEIEVENDEVTLTSFHYGEVKINEYDAMIKNGKLYIKQSPTDATYTEFGEIDGYELKLTNTSEDYAIPMDITLECTLTKVLKIVNIVMICIGGLGLATSIIFIVYDKVNAKKSESNPTQKA